MDKPGYTPGPWGIEKTATELWIGPMRPDGRKVDAIVTNLDWGRQYTKEYSTRQEANARLIAAAPEMFEALAAAERGYSNLVTYFDTDIDGPERETLAQIRSALSKALGEGQEDNV